jgi:sugar phosphate isomerase/epimerase
MLNVIHLAEARRPADLPECFARIREAGHDGIELELKAGTSEGWLASEDACRTVAREAHEQGTCVRSVLLADAPEVPSAAADADQRSLALETVRSAIQRCHWLGATLLRWVPAAVSGGPDVAHVRYQDALNRTSEALEILRPDLERHGVVVALIPCRYGFLLSPPELRELLERANSPMVGAALDVAACARVGDPLDWIETLHGHLRAVDLGESSAGDETVVPALRQMRFAGLIIRNDAN